MVDDIGCWLEELGLGKHAKAFANNEINLDALPHLTEDDLKELGLPIGPRRIVSAAIAGLAVSTSPTALAAGGKRTDRRGDAERRHLTVMFCDLVGSTALSGRLDPEDMRDVIRAYQNAVAGEVARFEGHVAKFMGDGVLSYFGYPKAHEDEAERAVRAGLGVAAAVGRLKAPTGEPLVARIGIATGLVVVGDLVGEGAAQEEAVVGETPNLGARLQAIAQPNAVVISPNTRRLLGGLFEVEDLGPQSLKGIGKPVRAWRVIGERLAESRFDATHAAGLTHFVGREQEIALLMDRWRLAKGGGGQVVLLSGEPGIGKSRITQTLRERIGGEPHNRLRYQCSPYYTNSALHPVIMQLEFAAEFAPEDTPERRLHKLEGLLARSTDNVDEVAPLFAALLSIPADDRYPPLNLTPQRQKEKTLEALVDQLADLTARQPVLMVFEDTHWIDPTTREFLDLTVDRSQNIRLLLVITYRPEFVPPWTGHSHVSALALNRLGRRDCAAMVENVTQGKALPAEVLDQIVAKTDGVPLFVEELTKTVLESGLLADAGDSYELTGPLPPMAIPASLHDSLMARLDRLAPVKEVAQIGAAIGREFSHEMLTAVAPIDDNELREALTNLVNSELIFRCSLPRGATYSFTHALVQDAAYQSLLKSKRRQLHARIADVLEERFPDRIETEPELFAHHLTEAGLAKRAIGYWEKAGLRAAERSANAEAAAHLAKGLELIGALPATRERAEQELILQAELGAALTPTKGYTAPETKAAYMRAHALCLEVGESAQLFEVLYGIWNYLLVAGELCKARELADEALGLAQRQENKTALLLAHNWSGVTCVSLGELTSAHAHLDRALALIDPSQHRSLMHLCGEDPEYESLSWQSWADWFLGYPERALRRSREALAKANELSYSQSTAYAMGFAAMLRLFRREDQAVQEMAEELISLCTDHDIPVFAAMGSAFRGWALTGRGEIDEGIEQIGESVLQLRAMEAAINVPYLVALMAEGCERAGYWEKGLSLLGEALDLMERTEQRVWEPEFNRLKGQLLLSRSMENDVRAEACFRRAIDIARRQSAKSWELRAATSLARVWAEQGERQKANDLLAPVYNWFTEGFDTADLKDAKALLDELS